MLDTALVSLAVMAGIVALAGVPQRCWQFGSGRFRSQIPEHAVARATFRLFAVLFLAPNALAWAYTLFVVFRDVTCTGDCSRVGVSSAVAVGMLGCAYALLEGFLLVARRRPKPPGGRPPGEAGVGVRRETP